jgi:hypothetical protein
MDVAWRKAIRGRDCDHIFRGGRVRDRCRDVDLSRRLTRRGVVIALCDAQFAHGANLEEGFFDLRQLRDALAHRINAWSNGSRMRR